MVPPLMYINLLWRCCREEQFIRILSVLSWGASQQKPKEYLVRQHVPTQSQTLEYLNVYAGNSLKLTNEDDSALPQKELLIGKSFVSSISEEAERVIRCPCCDW
jgi:hypothetical protein